MINLRALKNRIAKKLRRRVRPTNSFVPPQASPTQAELLIRSWFDLPRSTRSVEYSPSRIRHLERIAKHKLQWANSPISFDVSRQVRRRQKRKAYQAMGVA